MTDFLFTFSTYYIYAFAGITIVVAIMFFVKPKTEHFPYPDECFNCNNKSCQRCNLPNQQELFTYQEKLSPIPLQPDSCLQNIKASVPEDTENIGNQ